MILRHFSHAFVINLDSRPDRMATVSKEFSYFNIPVERFDTWKMENSKYQHPTAYGCKLSHINILKTAKQRHLQNVLVFEDNVILHNNMQEILDLAMNDLKNLKWDLLFFGVKRIKSKKITPNLIQLIKSERTHAYVANNTAYDILQESINDTLSIDKSWSKLYHKIMAYCVCPEIAIQDSGLSDINNKNREREIPPEFVHI